MDHSRLNTTWLKLAQRQADYRSAEELRALHQADLSRVRRVVNAVFDRLEEDMRRPADPEDEERNFWWGSRESVVTILPKLAQIILKIVPLEQKIADAEPEEEEAGQPLSTEDIAIIEHYVERIKDTGNADQA